MEKEIKAHPNRDELKRVKDTFESNRQLQVVKLPTNKEGFLSEDLSVISEYGKVNIYVLSHTPNVVGFHKRESLYVGSAAPCGKLSKFDRTIILYTPNDLMYFPVGLVGNPTIFNFSKDDAIIKKLNKILCD